MTVYFVLDICFLGILLRLFWTDLHHCEFEAVVLFAGYCFAFIKWYFFQFPTDYLFISCLVLVLGFIFYRSLLYFNYAFFGLGDVFLIALFGLILPVNKVIYLLQLSFYFGGALGVLLLCNGASRKDAIPFGPLLVIAYALI